MITPQLKTDYLRRQQTLKGDTTLVQVLVFAVLLALFVTVCMGMAEVWMCEIEAEMGEVCCD